MMNRYLIIDFDSTFVTLETLEELAIIVLEHNPQREKITYEIKQITDLGMEGKITFQESLSRRLRLFKPTQASIELLLDKLTEYITPSIARNKEFFLTNKEHIYIISGGFSEYIVPLVKEYGITEDHVLANKFIFDEQGEFIGIDDTNPLSRKGGKVEAVKSLDLNGAIYVVGDGYTDYEVREAQVANTFIAFTENVRRDSVIEKADCIAENFEEIVKMVNDRD